MDNIDDMLTFQYLIEELDWAVDMYMIPELPEPSEGMSNDDVMAD